MDGSTAVPEEECLAVWCAGEEWCAVTCAVDVVGNKWHPIIVQRLLDGGEQGFSALADDIDGITNKVLSESLDDLEAKGVVDREIVSEKPVRVAYSLTERGAALEPVIDALQEWGETHLGPAATESESVC